VGRALQPESGDGAANIAKLLSVPRPILKDTPRPPNSASRDN
jgi:hypothetical protein